MEVKGTLTYCNKCGFKIFRKGKLDISTVGCATYWKDIDELPEGWKQFGDQHLCPTCGKTWELLIKPKKEELNGKEPKATNS